MRAVTWHGKRDVRVDDHPDPHIQEPTDAIIRVTSAAICGSDLHLYELFGPFIDEGSILGHEAMGVVEEIGPEVTHISPGDRVVVPFCIACGRCYMCDRQLYTQCETTQVREHGSGAALFGYTRLYGSIPGGQAGYLRVPQAHFGPVRIPHGPPDERYLFLSDVLPTAWQAVEYADIPDGGSVTVFGLGPIGQMSARIASYLGARVIGVDLLPERLEMARRNGVEVIDRGQVEDVPHAIRDMTAGRGTDSVIDAVGLEAHGSPVAKAAQQVTTLLPDPLAAVMMQRAGVDRLSALFEAIETVRRGGTLSIVGVYAGAADPLPMLRLFDKQVQIRMGQANVHAWIDDLLPLLQDESDPLNIADLTTHTLFLNEAPLGYEIFQKKLDGAIKVVLKP